MRGVPSVRCMLVVALVAACGEAPPAPAQLPPVTAPAEPLIAPRPRADAPDAPQDPSLDALFDAYLAAERADPHEWRGPAPETVRCVGALRARGASAMTRLTTDLRGADDDVARRATDVLPVFGADAVLPMLAIISDPALQGEGGETPRGRALYVLRETWREWIDGPLAAQAADELMKLVRTVDSEDLRHQLIETLWCTGRAGAPYAEEWGRLAADGSGDPYGITGWWLHLIRGLGSAGAPAARSVISLLGGEHAERAIAALIDMERVAEADMDAMRALLRSRDPAAVKSVCAVLAGWGSAGNAARPELLQLLDEPAFAEFAASALVLVPDPDLACVVAMLRAAGAGSSSARERVGEWARVPALASRIEEALAGQDLPALQAGAEALVEHGGRDAKALVERLLRGRDRASVQPVLEALNATVARVLAARPVAEPLESEVVDGDFAWLVLSRGRGWRVAKDLRRFARDIEEGPPLVAAVLEAVAGRVDPRDALSSLYGAARLSLVLPPDDRARARAELAAHADATVRREVARAIAADASAEMGAVPLSASDLRVLVGLLHDAESDCRIAAAVALAAHGVAAAAAIPELDRVASDDEAWDVRLAAVVGLLRLRAAPDVVRPHVSAVLRHDWFGDTGDPHWYAFAAALAESPPAAVPLIDVLGALNGEDPNGIRTAMDALRPHGSAAAPAVPRLIDIVRGETKSSRDDGQPRFGVYGFMMWHRHPWIETDQDAGPAAARTLAAIGRPAASALPALRRLALYSDDRAAILAAIGTIEAAQ